MNLKVGIAGANRGTQFCKEFNRYKNVEVIAVMDPDQQSLNAFRRQCEVQYAFTNYEELLDSGIDIAVIASPMQYHAQQAIEALKRDIHVLCEVTAGITLEECKALLKAVKESKATYMMAENYCYIPENLCIGNMVKKGLFGDIYYAEGEYLHRVQDLHYDEQGNETWRKKFQAGRQGLTYGTHSLGPILQWFNEPIDNIHCIGSGPSKYPGYTYDDTSLMLCKTESEALIRIRLDMLSSRPHHMKYYTLQGTKGVYEAPRADKDYHRVWLKDYAKDSESWTPLSEFFSEFLSPEVIHLPVERCDNNHWGGDYLMIKDYLDSILNDKPVPIDIYRALELTIPCILSEESISSGGNQVKIPDFREW